MRLSCTLAFIAAASTAQAQTQAPLRYLAPDMRIERRELVRALLWPVGISAVGQDGQFVVFTTNSNAGIKAFDAAGKASPFHVSTGFRGDNEVMWPERIGRIGSEYWIADPFARQVALASSAGKIIGAIPHPTWVYPRWAERRKYPVFGRMNVLAVAKDSLLLVKPGRPHTLLDTPGFDRRATHVLLINRSGQIQREVARIDETTWRINVPTSNAQVSHVAPIPFATPVTWRVADDGSRVTVVVPGTTAADSGTFRVVALSGLGDTVFSRRYPMAAVPVTPAQRDSALNQVQGYGARTAQSLRDEMRKRMPAYRSFVADVVAGYDNFTWVITRSPIDSSTAREALIIDPRGEPVARVALPVGFQPRHADRDHLWGVDKTNLGVARLKVQATPAPPVTVAPPPRTAKASATKG